jgi:hypothetical protein
MYSVRRVRFIRNVAAATVNGVITLIILLIAPLGLVAVIINTLLVSASTFIVCSFGDGVIAWLFSGESLEELNHRDDGISRQLWQSRREIERRRRGE